MPYPSGSASISSPLDTSFTSSRGGGPDDAPDAEDDGDDADVKADGDGDCEEGEWVVLDMLDDTGKSLLPYRKKIANRHPLAFTSLLRILHRHSPPPLSSSFVPILPSSANPPTPTTSTTPSPTSKLNHLPTDAVKFNRRPRLPHLHMRKLSTTGDPQGPSAHASTFGIIPYPEWRIAVVERAQRAGVGDVGPALGWFLWGKLDGVPPSEEEAEEDDVETLEGEVGSEDGDSGVILRSSSFVSDSHHHTHHSTSVDVEAVGDAVSNSDEYGDVDTDEDGDLRVAYSDDSTEESSEAEWEGWMGDLERQQERRCGRGPKCSYAYACTYGERPDREGGQGEMELRKRAQGHTHVHAVTQRLFQEGRRALEPSAVVTPMMAPSSAALNASLAAAAAAAVAAASASASSSTSVSGFSSPLSSTTSVSASTSVVSGFGFGEGGLSSASAPGSGSGSGVGYSSAELAGGSHGVAFGGYGVTAHGRDMFKAPLRTKMSIEEVLGEAAAADTAGGSVRRMMVPTTRVVSSAIAPPVSPPGLSPRKRSVTDSGKTGGLMFTTRKVKERDQGREESVERTVDAERAPLPPTSRGSMDRERPFLPKLSLPFSTSAPTGSSSTLVAGRQAGPSTNTTLSASKSSRVGSIRSRTSILRHVRSGSSLYDTLSTSSGDEPPADGSRPGGSKKSSGMGLVRGVSVRAGKLVRGLDAALDFVDAR